MEHLGLCSSELRLPLCAISEQNRTRLTCAMEDFGVAV